MNEQLSHFDNSKDVQREIHPDLEFVYNSINLLIGKRGSGKTYNVFKQIVTLCNVPDHDYHMFLYITKNENDNTYLKLKDLIHIPTVIVSYEHSLETLRELRRQKIIYGQIRNGKIKNKEAIEANMEYLHINNYDKDNIHTLILYDDALNVFRTKNKGNEEYRMIFDNRHNRFTYFFCLQDPRSISTEIRDSIDKLWFFGGFGRLGYLSLMRTVSHPFDADKVYDFYRQIDRRAALLIDELEGKAWFIDYKGMKQEIDNDGNVLPPEFDESDDGEMALPNDENESGGNMNGNESGGNVNVGNMNETALRNYMNQNVSGNEYTRNQYMDPYLYHQMNYPHYPNYDHQMN